MSGGTADEVVAVAVRAAKAYGRPDLADHLARVPLRSTGSACRVAVVGEYKAGKSSLVNGLTGAEICPVDDDVATAITTEIRHGPRARAWLAPVGHDEPTVEIEICELAAAVLERAGVGAGGAPDRSVAMVPSAVGALVELPRPLLGRGLVLIDVPGSGGLDSVEGVIALSVASASDATLFVTDAGRELTASELAMLAELRRRCPTVAVVLTKVDVHRSWRRILEIDRGHLDGSVAAILPVATPLRMDALATGDSDLNEESGYGALVRLVGGQWVPAVDRLAGGRAGAEVVGVCDQLRAPFVAERAVLDDPTSAAESVAELATTADELERLAGAAAKWQVTLVDGFADLQGDVDHDLRSRFRRLLADVDDVLADLGGDDFWSDLERWAYRAVADELTGNADLADRRVEHLAEEVAALFVADAVAAWPPLADQAVDAIGDGLERLNPRDGDRGGSGLVGRGWTAFRAGYGGSFPIVAVGGMTLGVLGLGTLVAPIAGAVAVVVGRKAYLDDRDREVARRRQEARAAFRSYADEVLGRATVEQRKTLRTRQRQLRDHFGELATRQRQTVLDARRAADAAVRSAAVEAEARRRDVDAELTRIDALAASARRLEEEARSVTVSPGAQP